MKISEIIKIKSLFSSTLLVSSGIYTIANIINAAIPFILLPILTRRLTPIDYGIVAMFQVTVSFFFPFIGINLEGSIARKFYDKDNSDLSSYIGTSFFLFLISLGVISFIFFFNINIIEKITQIPFLWLKYVLVVAGCQFITSIILVLYQVSVKPLKYGIFQISQSLINIIFTIVFVVLMNKKFDGRILSQILSGLIFAIIGLLILIKNKRIKFNITIKDIRHALSFGIPLIPHAIGGLLFTAIDRFFLTNLVGLEQTGNYAVAFQLGAIISLFTVSFNNAFVPWLFDNLNQDKYIIKLKIVKFTYIYFAILVLGSIILLLLFPLVIEIFVGNSFKTVNSYSFFIVFGFVFQGMYYMVTNYFTYANKTYLLAIVTISVALLKIPITYFSIIYFGAVGAAISYFITFLLYFLIAWFLCIKVFEMPWFKLKLNIHK